MKYMTIFLTGMLFLLQGCYQKFDSADDNSTRPVTVGEWYRPAKQVKWSWQMSTDVENIDGVEVYVVDLFEQDASDITAIKSDTNKVMCMFHSAQVNVNDPDQENYGALDKKSYVDDNQTSNWLDITRASVQDNMLKRVDIAKEKGCDGVVPRDANMYKLSSTGVTISDVQQRSFNQKLANYAHDNNLSIGLVDDKDQVYSLEEYYDFALSRECYANKECGSYQKFIDSNKPVFNAEFNNTYYTDSSVRDTVCSDARTRKFSTIIIPSDLNNTYHYSCD